MHRMTSRLIFRQPRADDLSSLFAIYGDPVTHQFNPAGPITDICQAESLLNMWLQHWRDKGYGQWTVTTRKSPGRIIGFGGIDARMYLDIERLNLGYRFAVSAWGQGYATELGETALKYGFDELKVPHIFAVVRPNHLASIRVLEKIGMSYVEALDDVPDQPASLVYKATRFDPRE